MQPIRCRYQTDSELQDLLLEALQRLSRGEAVGIPSPQGYLAVMKGTIAPEDAPLEWPRFFEGDQAEGAGGWQWAWGLRDVQELYDLFCPVPVVAERLLTRSLPGGLIVKLPPSSFRHDGPGEQDSLAARCKRHAFPSEVVSAGQGGVGCRLLSGPVGLQLQALCPWPLMTASPAGTREGIANYPGRQPHCLEKFPPNCLNYIIEQGILGEASPPSVVEIQGQGVKIIQSGQIQDALIMERSGPCILFVCTGNTCRSPMAEAICRKMLADRLNCSPEELGARGIEITSAGVAAEYGHPASPESVALLAEEGVELADHQSQPLSASLLERADLILTMTAHHRHVILSYRPDLAERVRVLGVGELDIPDPIGGGMEAYRQCRQAIEAGLRPVIEELSVNL